MKLPYLLETLNRQLRAMEYLEPLYQDYITHVSPANMAISRELAALLWIFMVDTQPSSILDLGSGFSSVVFRKFQKQEPREIQVYTVDSSEEWLGKTQDFLVDHDLPSHGLYDITAFQEIQGKKMDLVLHDLGFMKDRIAFLPRVMEFFPALMIFDDLHWPEYRHALINAAIRGGESMRLVQLTPYTFDDFGRFAGCIYPLGGDPPKAGGTPFSARKWVLPDSPSLPRGRWA